MQPIGWIDSFYADLAPLYGSKTHFVNPNKGEDAWPLISINNISENEIKKIIELYTTIEDLRKLKKSGKIFFALNRFNRCILRSENDDKIIDAAIGLEAILSGERKTEITYTISNRIPIVFKHIPSELYNVNESRDILRKIYNYRSKIVHGAAVKDKDKFYSINGVNIEFETIAVDFLRHTLLFIIQYPEFLDPNKFDQYIDNVLLS